jgi:4-hydroxy-3-polyprenylbenzoate decarboxylase
MNAPFASGSNAPDAMVVIPCSMGTLGRIAHGSSEDVLLRAADVALKEKKKLILVPRETPWSLIHARNVAELVVKIANIEQARMRLQQRARRVFVRSGRSSSAHDCSFPGRSASARLAPGTSAVC